MEPDWMIIATGLLAAVNAMLIGAVVVWTLIEWGVL